MSTEGPKNKPPKKPDLQVLKNAIDQKLIGPAWNRSRRRLAREAGLKEDTLGNLFKDDRKYSLYADDLYVIAKTLGCSMEELITGEKPQKKANDIVAEVASRPRLQSILEQLSNLSDEELDAVSAGTNIAIATAKASSGRNLEKGDRYSA